MMGRTIAIGAWILAGAVYAAMLGRTLPMLSVFAGGQPIFDMMPTGYSLAQASDLVAALGEEGRAYYLAVQHRLDTVYPPLLGIALALSFRLLFRGNVARALVALAALVAGLDLAENAAVADMLKADPAGLSAEMVTFASRLTVAKSVLTSLAFVAILVGSTGAVWRRFSQRTPDLA